MQTEPTPKPPAKRRRFQFSLRTLVFAVLTYGGLWLLTLKVGGVNLTRAYKECYSGERTRFKKSPNTVLEIYPQLDNPEDWTRPRAIRGYVRAPAPLVLIWQWESLEEDGKTWQPVPNGTCVYFWVLWCDPPIEHNWPVFEHTM